MTARRRSARATAGGAPVGAFGGVPVVPLVRMITEECLVALGAGCLLLRLMRSARASSVLPDGASVSGLVARARSLPSAGSACATAAVYSSS